MEYLSMYVKHFSGIEPKKGRIKMSNFHTLCDHMIVLLSHEKSEFLSEYQLH